MEWTPGKVVAAVVGGIAAVALTIFLISGLGFGLWQMGWWYNNANNARQNHITAVNNNFQNHLFQKSWAAQTGGQQQLSTDMQAVVSDQRSLAQDKKGTSAYTFDHAAVLGAANDACRVVANLQGANFSLGPYTIWAKANCQYGAVSPSSTLNN